MYTWIYLYTTTNKHIIIVKRWTMILKKNGGMWKGLDGEKGKQESNENKWNFGKKLLQSSIVQWPNGTWPHFKLSVMCKWPYSLGTRPENSMNKFFWQSHGEFNTFLERLMNSSLYNSGHDPRSLCTTCSSCFQYSNYCWGSLELNFLRAIDKMNTT